MIDGWYGERFSKMHTGHCGFVQRAFLLASVAVFDMKDPSDFAKQAEGNSLLARVALECWAMTHAMYNQAQARRKTGERPVGEGAFECQHGHHRSVLFMSLIDPHELSARALFYIK